MVVGLAGRNPNDGKRWLKLAVVENSNHNFAKDSVICAWLLLTGEVSDPPLGTEDPTLTFKVKYFVTPDDDRTVTPDNVPTVTFYDDDESIVTFDHESTVAVDDEHIVTFDDDEGTIIDDDQPTFMGPHSDALPGTLARVSNLLWSLVLGASR